MQLTLHEYELPLRHTFTTSHGSKSSIHTLIVELTDAPSHPHRGFGEAPANRYYGVTVDTTRAALEHARPLVESTPLEDPADFWSTLAPRLADHPFALCALDQAAHDLWGKRRGRPVHQLWGLTLDRIPPSNYTIGLDTIDTMTRKLRQRPDFPVYKIKLGSDHDLDIIRALRQATEAPFRVDANCGWTAEQTLHNAEAMKDLGVEFIEQPLPRDQWHPMARLCEASPLPLIADESCIAEDDVDRCRGRFHGINIKLTKCGGLTPARRMIRRARQLGMSVMVGCMTESTIGISAIAQLLPLLDYVDMDGAQLLARDAADGVRLDHGFAAFPDRPGTSVQLLDSSA